MKPEQLHILQTAVRKARAYLIDSQRLPTGMRSVREVEDNMRVLVEAVEAVVNMPGPVPSGDYGAPVKPIHPWPAPIRNPAPSQAIGLMRSYLELPGSEVLTPDRWAKRVAGYLFENMGSLP